MDYWKKRKLRNIIIIAVLVLAALWGVRMLLRPHARMVTVKYVEDEATLHSVRNSGGYTRAVSTDDKEMIEEWIDFMVEIEKGDEPESAYLDNPFPCYIIEYRMKKNTWIAMLQVTENRAARTYQILGSEMFELDADKDFFQRAGELMEKTEALRSR